MKNDDVNILAFNYGHGKFTNGPGISCWNFSKFCNKNFNIFTKLHGDIKTFDIKNYQTNNYGVVHWWSGLTDEFLKIAKKERRNGKKIILGPNLLDGTNPEIEIKICREIHPDLILVVNKEIKYNLKKYLNYKIEVFMTGPDYDLWVPKKEYENKILWKGNSSHESKDIGMAIEVRKKIVDKITLMGYDKVYRYMEHVEEASKYAGYLCTSLSETKSEATLEQMAAGVPVITHPKVFMMGIHYKTGIVVNKNVDEMVRAAEKLLGDKELRRDLSDGARSYILENFKKEDLSNYYSWLLNEC
jgi:glycosyltransferase involved in cell wall biosynthesis